jgi:2,3-bisphosphoglycerate-independent phosphoglycerate mutase
MADKPITAKPFAMPQPFAMLVILDGWGWREPAPDNAVTSARTPNFDRLWAAGPHAFLTTHGLDVGLPVGQMGNSEVGHMNIGAGRVVMQELPRIDAAIADGSLAASRELADFIAAMRASGGTAHLMGLVSPGGVHSHQDQAAALAKLLTAQGIKVAVHAFLDGRDTPPSSAPGYIAQLEAALPEGAFIATVIGRYFAMDRDKRWDRVGRAYAAMARAEGEHAPDPQAAIAAAYAAGHTDEFAPPAVIGGYAGMRAGDGILSFNFRADRVREILAALLDPGFDGFPRERIRFAAALGMTRYSDALAPFMPCLFPPPSMANLLGEVVAASGLTQLRMAETEKYPHVTYFLNGGREESFAGEERIMIPSPKVATYDLQPEMSAPALGDAAVAAIRSGRHNLIVLNFANPDMVGHSGIIAAAIKAVETVDTQLGRIADAVAASGGTLLVTADHGNCEQMLDAATGEPHTAHTTNPVPVLLAGQPGAVLHDGRLADVAPTLLHLLGLAQPAEMTGRSLLGPPAG